MTPAPAALQGRRTLPGLDPRWSRTVTAPDGAGVSRTWHVLDNAVEPTVGTMLCVHGNPTWSYLWRRFLGAAPAGWRVVAVDQLGMGWSDRLEAPRTMAERIDDLDRVLDALEVTGPVVLAAHDWGGPISLGWAVAHPDRVAGIVLGNTGVHTPPDVAWPVLLRLARSRALRDTVCVRTPTFVRVAAALSRPPLPAAVRQALALPYGKAAERRSVGDFVADIPFEADHPTRVTLDATAEGIGDLDVPALLLWGPRDPVFSERYLRDLLARLPQADVHRYASASHLVFEDAPQAAEDAWRWVSDHVPADAPARRRAVWPPQDDEPMPWAALSERADDPATAVVELSGTVPRRISFAELEQSIGDLAAGLSEVGVLPGHRVAVLVPPGIDLTVAVYACWRIGAVIVVADAGLGLPPMGRALRGAGPDWVIGIPQALAAVALLRVPGRRIVAGEPAGMFRRLLKPEFSLSRLTAFGRRRRDSEPLPPPPLDAESAVLFTSGATGPPKGVVYNLEQLRAQVAGLRSMCAITADDRLVAAFAPFALYGPALGVAAAVPDMDVTAPGTLTARALAEAVEAVGATVVFASPAALRNVVATAGELSDAGRTALAGVRLLLSFGAPVPVSLLRDVSQVMTAAELHTPYGMTEALPVADISLMQIEAAGPGNGVCVGRPLPGVSVAVSPLDPAGVAEGQVTTEPDVTGEVLVKGPHVKDRYDRLWVTERTSSRTPGWHRTGDVGHLDDAGRLWVEGRLVHVVTTAAGPVTPVGVEQRVEELAAVRAAAVVGVGPAGTQQVVVVVVHGERQSGSKAPRKRVLADAELAAAVRGVAGLPVAAVLTLAALPVDIRHASKVDRARVARWAGRVLSGQRPGRL